MGLTANILIDCARIAFNQEPMMKHHPKGLHGDEELIQALHECGGLDGKDVDFLQLFGENSNLLKSRMQ